MLLRTRRRSVVRLFFAFATAAALGTAWAGPASAGEPASAAVSWDRTPVSALVLPPPHEPDRGSCTPTRNRLKIRMDCIIKKPDTTLWVACSGGFVEIRHIPEGPAVAEGTCPIYGGYALTYTSAD